MTVRCLSDFQKINLVGLYQQKLKTQKELAQVFSVSERTVNRVLIDAGVATPVARIKGDACKVMRLLRKHNITPENLDAVLMDCGHAVTSDDDLIRLLVERDYTDMATIFGKACLIKLRDEDPADA